MLLFVATSLIVEVYLDAGCDGVDVCHQHHSDDGGHGDKKGDDDAVLTTTDVVVNDFA